MRAGHANRTAIGFAFDHGAAMEYPSIRAVGVADAILAFEIRRLVCEVRLHRGHRPGHVVGVHTTEPIVDPVGDGRRVIAEHVRPFVAKRDASGRNLPLPGTQSAAEEHHPESIALVLQLAPLLDQRSDVLVDAEQPRDAAAADDAVGADAHVPQPPQRMPDAKAGVEQRTAVEGRRQGAFDAGQVFGVHAAAEIVEDARKGGGGDAEEVEHDVVPPEPSGLGRELPDADRRRADRIALAVGGVNGIVTE